MEPRTHKHHHHILPTQLAVGIGLTLLFLTAVTVWVAHIDLGRFNFLIAMAVATCKALLVALFFMNLKYDYRENSVIFGTSFLFLIIFIVLTSTDLFFRGDVYVKGPLVAVAETKSKIKNPWISTPEMIAKGKQLYSIQCVSCHGVDGKGDGPAASALNPKPRNFHSSEGWKNGRKATMIYKTLKEGLPPSAMASYATLPADDRWALVHYVISLSPEAAPADTPADFAKIGINPAQQGGGETEAPTIPLSLAIRRMTEPQTATEEKAHLYHPEFEQLSKQVLESKPGARFYQEYCIQCHGSHGQGGIKVRSLGVNPTAYVTTSAFHQQMNSLKSFETFSHLVIEGLPGELMPGLGDLDSKEMQDLYSFVKEFASQK